MAIGLFLFFFTTLLVSSVVAVPEPALLKGELAHYQQAGTAYTQLYNPPPAIPVTAEEDRFQYYSHILGGDQQAEEYALNHALTPGNGPFHVSRGKRALYVSTLIHRDSRLGTRWTIGPIQGYRRDAHAFWRVDRRGAKLLRLDLWPPGAVQQERMSMQAALDQGEGLGGGGGCFGCV